MRPPDPAQNLGILTVVATADAYKMKELRKFFQPSDIPSVCPLCLDGGGFGSWGCGVCRGYQRFQLKYALVA